MYTAKKPCIYFDDLTVARRRNDAHAEPGEKKGGSYSYHLITKSSKAEAVTEVPNDF